jgi:hypothetical protein
MADMKPRHAARSSDLHACQRPRCPNLGQPRSQSRAGALRTLDLCEECFPGPARGPTARPVSMLLCFRRQRPAPTPRNSSLGGQILNFRRGAFTTPKQTACYQGGKQRAAAGVSDLMIRDPEMDVDRAVRRRALVRRSRLTAALRTLAPRWLAPSIQSARRSLDREHQHFIEPWE